MAYKIKGSLHQAFVDNIRSRRQQLGLTQNEVAQKIGLKQETYAQIEHGRASPTIKTIEKVAVGLDINPLQLLIPQQVPVNS